MPSAEETTTGNLMEMVPDAADRAQEGFGSRDVDVLVSRIKENLRLSSCLKSRSSFAARHASLRSSPYKLPSRSWSDQTATCEQCLALKQQQQQQESAMDDTMTTKTQPMCCHHREHYRRCRKAALQAELDDSYELFAALLRKGALIKEAVKRLQTYDGDCDDEVSDGELIHDDVFIQNTATSGTTAGAGIVLESPALRRKRFYYDDEEEPLPL